MVDSQANSFLVGAGPRGQDFLPGQRNIITTAGQLQAVVENNAVESPAPLITGSVVSLSRELQWFLPPAQERELRCA